MKQNLSVYLFARKGKLTQSSAGERDLNEIGLDDAKIFFAAGRQSELYTLLQRLICRMHHFKEIRRHDYMLERADCIEDLCAQVPVMASALVDRPDKKAAEKELRRLFLSVGLQKRIIASGSRMLIGTLIWWGRRIGRIWQDVFGSMPDVFAEELACKF